MDDRITVYVQLMNEGTDAWRPTSALKQADGGFVLTDENFNPSDEEWAISPGSKVRLVPKDTDDGQVWVVAPWWSDLPRFKFGDNAEMADRISALVVSGAKTATCGSVASLTPENTPTLGSQWIVEDSADRAVCVIETTELNVRRFHEVDADFARDEGEGDLSLEDWRDGHRTYFLREGTFAPDMELLCERFRLVEVITPETAQ